MGFLKGARRRGRSMCRYKQRAKAARQIPKCSSGRSLSPKLSCGFFVLSVRLVTVLWEGRAYAALR
jgi:hypothetical protein